MNITSFKKACKRYADAHSLPLSAAQETFSQFFGYPNFDAALKSAGKSLNSSKNSGENLLNHYWANFTRIEFNLVIHMLKKKFELENPSQDSLSWFSKSFVLFQAVTFSMDYLGLKPTSADEFRTHFSIDFMQKVANSDDLVLSNDPAGLGWYAKNLLPGFRSDVSPLKYTMSGADQFGYRLAYIEEAFLKCLSSLESQEGKEFLRSMLESMTAERRLPNKDEIGKLSEKINMLSIYA